MHGNIEHKVMQHFIMQSSMLYNYVGEAIVIKKTTSSDIKLLTPFPEHS